MIYHYFVKMDSFLPENISHIDNTISSEAHRERGVVEEKRDDNRDAK